MEAHAQQRYNAARVQSALPPRASTAESAYDPWLPGISLAGRSEPSPESLVQLHRLTWHMKRIAIMYPVQMAIVRLLTELHWESQALFLVPALFAHSDSVFDDGQALALQL